MVVILVVSGERAIGRHVRSVLGSQGWWVTTAADREAALRASADHEPALVIVDCEVDGASELVRAFGSKNGGPGVLILEPPEGSEESFGAFEAGADQILSKPPRAQELLDAASRVMSLPHQSGGVVAHEFGDKLGAEEIFGELLAELGETAPEPQQAASEEPSPAGMDDSHDEPGGEFEDSAAEMTAVEVSPAPELPAIEDELSEVPPSAESLESPEAGESSEPEKTVESSEEVATVASLAVEESPFAEFDPEPAAGRADLDSLPAGSTDPPVGPSDATDELPLQGGPVGVKAESSGAALETGSHAAEAEEKLSGDQEDSEETQPAVATPALPQPGPSASSEGVRFGQYRLDERIAVGGMAEVWRASMLGVEGFRKTVAIKKILPHLAENSEFVTMFIEEAKLAAQLSHENLVEIYDLGRIGASFFIAMEFVDGRDLRSLLNRLRRRSDPIPIGLALLISSEVARGLEYAHTRCDSGGEPMGLVHRDVSPRNMLIGQDGRVRLCDFGVAKAVSSVIQTEIGALKGKLQYMSPEQASGKSVDARSDIYSLGSVLYEMIAGRRLYEADNELSLLDAVRAGNFDDPRKHSPGLPQEVRRILMKALSKKPGARYQTAGALEDDLRAIIRSMDPPPSEQTLSGFVNELFSEPLLVVEGVEPVASEVAGSTGLEDSVVGTRSVVLEGKPTARRKIARFWWGVVAGLLAAGLVAGALKLFLG